MKKSILITLVIFLVACSTSEVEDGTVDEIISKTETGITLNTVMSNSFGFGGTNAALIFEKV